MAFNTIYSPKSWAGLSADILNFAGTGVTGTAVAGTTTSIDHLIAVDTLINGAMVILDGQILGDSMTMQVVDKDGVVAPPGTVLSQFASNWYVAADSQQQALIEVPYPAKLMNGLYVRFIYNSTGSSSVSIYINLLLHKVLA